jgi:hypothetical protein
MEGIKMKTAIRLMLIFAVCGALALPGVAMADERPIAKMKASPGNHGKSFGMDKGAKELSILVVNGSGKTREKVASVRITVNGQEVFGPRHFSAGNAGKVASASKNLVVKPDLGVVDLKVEVKGKKNSEITVTIVGFYEESEPPAQKFTWFLDEDGDGVGGMMSVEAETKPDGPWVLTPGDCNDDLRHVIYPPDPLCLY